MRLFSSLCAILWLPTAWLFASSSARAQDDPAQAPQLEAFDLMGALAEGTPLSADGAAARAVEAAPAMARTQALARAAEAAVQQARAGLLPRLQLTARYAHVDGFPAGRIATVSDPAQLAMARTLAGQVADPAAQALLQANIDQLAQGQSIVIPKDQVALGARLTYPVSDLFFAMLPAIDAAEASVRSTHAQRRAVQARLRLSARERYYELARARGTLAVARRAVAQARVQQARVDAGVRAGLRPAADASSLAARVASAEQAAVAAEGAVDVASAALSALLNDDPETRYGIADPLLAPAPPAELPPVSRLVDRAQQARPEFAALRDKLAAQEKRLQATEAGGYPHVSVFAGADYARPNRYVIPPGNRLQPNWEAGVLLTYSPNDTWVASHASDQAAAQQAAQQAELRELQQALIVEVSTARALLVRASRKEKAAHAAEVAALDAYEQRMAELHAGTVTMADLFAAENELNRARLLVLDAAVERHLARARLDYTLGLGTSTGA